MKTILYLVGTNETSCARLKFDGARHRLAGTGYALRKTPVAGLSSRDLSDLIDFWQACGMIVDCCGRHPPVGRRKPLPTPVVYLDIAREFESRARASVSYDIRTTCHLAARELIALDCAAYGYAGYGTNVPWSEERKRVFARALKLNGHPVRTFDLNPAAARPSVFYRRLAAWLQKAPKPFGVFAADDVYAIHLHSAVQKLKLRIPAEVAILGVDNDADLLGTPGISSIQLDFHQAGMMAADLLLERLANPAMPPVNRHLGPVQLLRRSSTRKLNRSHDTLTATLQRIRENAPRGLSAAEAASWLPGSRRLAEIRFRELTGHSLLEEITAARIERAKELLATTGNHVGEIAGLCGYRTFNAFRNAFKSVTNQTPRDWRRTSRIHACRT